MLARERDLQSITDNSPDVIARFDRGLRHVFVSAAAARLTGQPTSWFIGRTNRDLGMPDALCTYWESSMEQVFREQRPINIHFELEVEGEPRHFSTRLVPEFDDAGAVRHVLAVARDVTEAWEAEQALRRADQAKDAFLATLSHELRNPLAPIRAGIGVLQRGAGEKEQARALSIMDRQVKHMVQLVDDLLDLARISQGKVVLRRDVLPLREVIEEAVEATRPLLDAQGHDFAWELSSPEPYVHGDATRLAQVVGNLLTNAAKYTPPRGRVRLRALEEGNEVCILVEDTGVGIPRDMLARVFDRFVQRIGLLNAPSNPPDAGARRSESSQAGLGSVAAAVGPWLRLHPARLDVSSGAAPA